MNGTPISFDQFGRNFIDLVVDAPTLAREIDRSFRGKVIAGEGEIWGEVLTQAHQATLGSATVNPSGDAAFEVTIPIALRLDLDLAVEGESYDIDASVRFTLRTECYAPLTIHLATDPIGRDQVTVGAIVRRKGLGVAKLLLPDQLATQLVDMVNQQLASSDAARTVDVLGRVRETLAAEAPVRS